MPRGRPPKAKTIEESIKQETVKKDKRTEKNKFVCFYCGSEYVDTNYYKTNSIFYGNIGKRPYCKQCIEKLYQYFFEKYINEGCLSPEKKAVKRLCMIFDIYYREDAYNVAIDSAKKREINISPMGAYMKIIQLTQYNRKKETYENTICQEEQKELSKSLMDMSNISERNVNEKTIKFFGAGFTDEDYEFLQEQYDDWTARHECQTKAQEEVFKRICFKQLEILKATRLGEDTKNLDDTFQKLLDTAKLQPKQNSGETVSDAQTFGTLIDKWENERPLPEIDEELKDVDKIGLYIDTFFKGHTCKMLGEKNAFSNLYSSMMKKFTVDKPEYQSDEDYDTEIIFDKMFGNGME